MRAMLRLGLKGLFAPLNLWLWAMLTLRCSGIGVLTRQLLIRQCEVSREFMVRHAHHEREKFIQIIAGSIIAAAVSPVRERQLPLLSTTEI